MKIEIACLFCSLLLVSCGADDSSDLVQDDSEDWFAEDDFDADFDDYGDDDGPDLGQIAIDLADSDYNGPAYCDLLITRSTDQSVATINLQLSLAGDPEKLFGSDLEEDNIDLGDVTLNGGQDSTSGFSMMSLYYSPPRIRVDGEDEGWIFDFLDPHGSLEIVADGQVFDAITSPARGADNRIEAPHSWDVAIQFDAGLMQPEVSGTEVRSEGKFQYDGICAVDIIYVNLQAAN